MKIEALNFTYIAQDIRIQKDRAVAKTQLFFIYTGDQERSMDYQRLGASRDNANHFNIHIIFMTFWVWP